MADKKGIKEQWNEKSTTTKLFIGIVGVCCLGLILIVGIGGFFSPDVTTYNVTQETVNQTSDTPTPKKDENLFENQYISFEIPDGLTVKDNSTDNLLEVILLDNGKDIGEINDAVNTKEAVNSLEGTKVKISNKTAIESFDSTGVNTYIILPNNQGIWISLDSGYESQYEIIKKSLIIKKVPVYS